MTAVATETVTVALADGCVAPGCLQMSGHLHGQLSRGYRHGVSAMRLDGFDGWLADRRTVRKRARRCERLGYRFAEIDRHDHEADIYAINTSKPVRQGRPMTAGYHEIPCYGPNPVVCSRHHVYTYGVVSAEPRLVAYLWLYRCGELALVSSILGHAAALAAEVMYLLARGTVEAQTPHGGMLVYNLHDSGTDGLRFFKERLGLAPTEVEWLL